MKREGRVKIHISIQFHLSLFAVVILYRSELSYIKLIHGASKELHFTPEILHLMFNIAHRVDLSTRKLGPKEHFHIEMTRNRKDSYAQITFKTYAYDNG